MVPTIKAYVPKCIETPPQSPIEHIWKILEQNIRYGTYLTGKRSILKEEEKNITTESTLKFGKLNA